MREVCIGWLSPEGKLHACELMDHWAVAKEICSDLGQKGVSHPDDWLLNHGWVHLTVTTYIDHGWAVIFPYNTRGRLTKEQHDFLKPYVEQNKDFLAEAFVTDLKYEFEELF